MNVNRINLYADIKKAIKILHITDLHLTLSDDRQDDYCRKHAVERSGVYSVNGGNPACRSITEILAAEGDADLFLFTGDIADFPSLANIDFIRDMLKGKNYIFCHGNHDWNYPREYPFGTSNWDFDQSSLYREALNKTSNLFDGITSGFDVKKIGGIKVIAINNSNYRFSLEQYQRLVKELEDDIPAIIAFHIPLYAPTLMQDTLNYWHLPIICGGSDDIHAPFWSYRTDEPTAKACKLIGEHKNVLAAVTGHLHFDHVDTLPGGNTQYVTALACQANATVFTVLPKK